MNNEKEEILEDNSLDNLERVKTLSPNMMVVKRFFRNKLAIVGLGILIFMFLFSFLGGIVAPYSQSQVFRKNETLKKVYAGAAINTDMNVLVKEGYDYNASDISMAVLEYQINGELSFIGKDKMFINMNSDESYGISKATAIAKIKSGKLQNVLGANLTDEIKKAFEKAQKNNQTVFYVNTTKYGINNKDVYKLEDVAIASYVIFNMYDESTSLTYDFRNAAEVAMINQKNNFFAEGKNYEIEYTNNGEIIVIYSLDGTNKKEYAMVSKYTISSVNKEFLDIQFKYDVIDAIKNNKDSFESIATNGKNTKFYLENDNGQYQIKREQVTVVNDSYAKPTKKHWVGTDSHGMDLLVRLMYGGRVSLIIGFIVVALELLIGVILGGIAGYFGKWADTLIMRIVELFNCIPTMPLYIILGTIMDYKKVPPGMRIYILAVLLACFYWTGVARMVRGQILSLREQEFMVATEAMGIKTSKRIFKHLIPNVLPQLIVIATMDLGSVILTEASLSFLGLGVKFPLASWGGIINAVNDVYVMTNYWWVWIPAGICILLTVLGFNFVGDGLRDAFDPKMKR